jgi:hypothetical protein
MDPITLLTGALSIATVWLAIATQRMATAAKASIELESRPYLAIENMYYEVDQVLNVGSAAPRLFLRAALRLQNPGRVLVHYAVPSLTWEYAAQSGSTGGSELGGVIHPGQNTLFWFAAIPISGEPNRLGGGHLTVTIDFWSTRFQRMQCRAKLQFVVKSPDASRHEWVFLEGPEYLPLPAMRALPPAPRAMIVHQIAPPQKD